MTRSKSDEFIQLEMDLARGLTLYLDNDCCYTRSDEDPEIGNGYSLSPLDLAIAFIEATGVEVRFV